MNDFDYEVMMRKRLSRQSRGTIKSKRVVTLPHDGITRKEWKAMNGEIKTYVAPGAETPRGRIDWKSFRALTDEQQSEYLRILQETFGVDMKRVASALGVSNTTLSHRCTAIGYEVKPFRKAEFDPEMWNEFTYGGTMLPQEEKTTQSATGDDCTENKPDISITPTNYEGGIEDALKSLVSALKGTGAKITIEVTL